MVRSLITQTKINLFLSLLGEIAYLSKEEAEIVKLLSMDEEVLGCLRSRPKDRFVILPSPGFLDENENLDTEVF